MQLSCDVRLEQRNTNVHHGIIDSGELEHLCLHVVQLDSIFDQFQQLRLLHGLLPSNNLQLEPVDVYIVQVGSILDRLLQLRLLD